jgi:subtilase family serine protease
MKNLLLVMFAGLMFGGLSADEAKAQRQNEKLKLPTERIKRLLPDLTIGDITVGKSSDGLLQHITVEFKNVCKAAAKGKFDITAVFRESGQPNSKILHTVSTTFDELAAGGSHKHFFDVASMKLPATSHIKVEIDTAQKIAEDFENNNWMMRNPNSQPFPPDGATHCKPKS